MVAPVEAAERGDPSGDGGAHSSISFHASPEDLEVGSADTDESQVVVGAPLDEEPKIGGVAHKSVLLLYPARNPATAARSVKSGGSSMRTTSAEMVAAIDGLLGDPEPFRAGTQVIDAHQPRR